MLKMRAGKPPRISHTPSAATSMVTAVGPRPTRCCPLDSFATAIRACSPPAHRGQSTVARVRGAPSAPRCGRTLSPAVRHALEVERLVEGRLVDPLLERDLADRAVRGDRLLDDLRRAV